MFLKLCHAVKHSIKMQYIIALTAMWAGGIGICIYLVGFSAIKDMSNELKFLNMGTKKAATDSLPGNEAYVFVNVNEKHFLTRFVASVTNEEETEKKKNYIPVSNALVEKISKKIVVAPEKKAADFIIKPAPEL
jgi:hypothetical protein